MCFLHWPFLKRFFQLKCQCEVRNKVFINAWMEPRNVHFETIISELVWDIYLLWEEQTNQLLMKGACGFLRNLIYLLYLYLGYYTHNISAVVSSSLLQVSVIFRNLLRILNWILCFPWKSWVQYLAQLCTKSHLFLLNGRNRQMT